MRTRSLLALALLAAPLQAQLTIRVSVGPGGVQGNGPSAEAALSADGNLVSFLSASTNLVAGDSNGWPDIFVRDLVAGTTQLVSVGFGGGPANGPSLESVLSADGRFVAFTSSATNLVASATNGNRNVFVRDRLLGTTQLASPGTSGTGVGLSVDELSISADGRYLAFCSSANDVIAGDLNPFRDVFVFDRVSGTTQLLSVDSAALQHTGTHETPAISGDGRLVAFTSDAALAPGGYPGDKNVFLRDLAAGTTICVSVPEGGGTANLISFLPSISADGEAIAFVSWATNLTADVLHSTQNVFVRELAGGHTRLLSRASSSSANGASSAPGLSGDGRFGAFTSLATNLSPSDPTFDQDLFLRDTLADELGILSLSQSGSSPNANVDVSRHFLSADGQTSVFESDSTGFVPNDTNGTTDVFLHGRAAPPVVNLCSGDGSNGPCPCGNFGGFGRGCNNSNSTGGAILLPSGTTRLSLDGLVLRVQGEPPDVFNLFLQGDAAIASTSFGDGLSCVGGQVLRLYSGFAVNGSLAKPSPGELSVSTKPAALGFPIPPGATRVYQVMYRDPEDNFCPAPLGANVNLSQAVALVWGP